MRGYLHSCRGYGVWRGIPFLIVVDGALDLKVSLSFSVIISNNDCGLSVQSNCCNRTEYLGMNELLCAVEVDSRGIVIQLNGSDLVG